MGLKDMVNIKLPGDVPLWKVAVAVVVVFGCATGAIFYLSKDRMLKSIVHPGKAAQPAAAASNVAKSTTTAGVPPAVDKDSSTASIERALAQLNESELIDNKIVAFLIHSYEAQKIEVKNAQDKITKLEDELATQKMQINELLVAVNNQKAAMAAAAAAQDKQAKAPKAAATAAKPASEDAEIKRIAELYTQMTPEAVAEVAEKIDDATLVRIFSKMKSRTVAKILAGFDPDRVARINMKMVKDAGGGK